MTKITLIFLFFLLPICSLLGQDKYYTTDGESRLSKLEVEAFKLSLQEKTSYSFGTKTIVDIVEEERFYIEDSIIVKVKFEIQKQEKKPESETILSEGDMLPTFNLKKLYGGEALLDTFLGKPTLLNFWFTGCAPCIEEMPSLNKIAEIFNDKINFVAITFEPSNRIERFLARKDFDFIHLVEANDYIEELSIKTFPKNIVIDSKGKVIFIGAGIPTGLATNKSMNTEKNTSFVELLNSILQQNQD